MATAKGDGLTFLESFSEREHFLPNRLCRGLGIGSHWSVSGHIRICEPITVAREMECFDWPGLDHVPIPGTESRINWAGEKRGVALKEKWGAVMEE